VEIALEPAALLGVQPRDVDRQRRVGAARGARVEPREAGGGALIDHTA
jgi:hypothetical protein